MKSKPAYLLKQTSEYIHLQFNKPHKVISSAVCNGGVSSVNHILNLKVPLKVDHNDSPCKTLRTFPLKGVGRVKLQE